MQRCGKAHRVKRHVVLAQELDVADVIRLPPPVLPATRRVLFRPLLRRRDIGDRRVEPDIEHLVLEARHRHAPAEIAGDAAIAQIRREPALRQRRHERRPPRAGAEPGIEAIHQQRLAQKAMTARAQLDVRIARERRTRPHEVCGIQQRPAAVALVSARSGRAAMRTGAEHVAVGQEAPVHRRPHLAHGAFFDQAAGLQPFVEMPGQCMVLPAGRAAEVIERQAEAAIDVRLDRMLRIAVVPHVLAGLDRAELRRSAVLVGAADEQYLVAELAAETRVHIRGQKRADEIAEVLDAVDVGQRAGDQNLAHDTSVRVRGADPEKPKPFRTSGRARVLGACLARLDARQPFRRDLLRSGRRIRVACTKCVRVMVCSQRSESVTDAASYIPFNPPPGP